MKIKTKVRAGGGEDGDTVSSSSDDGRAAVPQSLSEI
jgi:hypothetical protein